jgi:glycine oxidase
VHPGTEQHGSLVLAQKRDAPELDRFARRSTHHEMIDAARLGELEPDLAGRFDRGLFFAEEGHLDPRKALASLAARLAERGVDICFGVDGDTLSLDGLVVDCRGLSARDRQEDLRGVRGEMLHVRCPDITLSRPVRLLHPRIPLYIVPRGDSVFMIGATMIESDARGQASARSVVELLNGAYALHPAFGDAEILEIGCDVRPAYTDNVPKLRRDNGRFYVNGLYRHGFLMSPAMARMAAAAVLDGASFPEVS